MTAQWFPLVIIYIVTNSASKLIQKYALKDEEIDSTAFSAFFLFIVGVITVPFVFIEGVEYEYNIKAVMAVLGSGILYAACMTLYYHALQKTEVSQVETIATTRSIWLMLLGLVFFQETLSLSKILGVLLIFTGLTVIYWNQGAFKSFGKPQLYTLVYAILISTCYALDKYALNYLSVSLFQVIIYILPAVFIVLFMPKTFHKLKYFIKPHKSTYQILLSCVFQMSSTLALYAAYKAGGELSVVGPLAQTSTVFTIVIGMLILKEKWNLKQKVSGIAFTLLGVIFIKLINF